jgi:hypothetical protein
MTNGITLYTSLAPNAKRLIQGSEVGPAYITECIGSWKRAGFEVVSLNSASEISELVKLNYDVQYQQISSDRPSIIDFLTTIASSARPVAGIVNSDVFMTRHPGWLGLVETCPGNGMILAERINIDPATLSPTGRTCNGFDAFVFATEPLSRIDQNCDLLFGQPWWDYWLPLAYIAAGGKLVTGNASVLFHLDHAQNWNQAQWLTNAKKTITYFQQPTKQLPADIVVRLRGLAGPVGELESELGAFADWCFARLRRMADFVQLSDPVADDALRFLIASFSHELTSSLLADLNEAQSEIARIKRALNGEIGALASWADWKMRPTDALPGATIAALYEQIQHLSRILNGSQAKNSEDILRAATEAARILGSRAGSLRHFYALNVGWITRNCMTVAALVNRRLAAWHGDIDTQFLQLARKQGEKYLDAVDYMVSVAERCERKEIGDYVVVFSQQKAEGMDGLSDGKPEGTKPDSAYCRIQIAVLDSIDKRFVPELKVRAKLTDEAGCLVADLNVPFVWHPALFHYGTDVSVAKSGRHDLHIAIEAPSFTRHRRFSGNRYATGVELTFKGLEISPHG